MFLIGFAAVGPRRRFVAIEKPDRQSHHTGRGISDTFAPGARHHPCHLYECRETAFAHGWVCQSVWTACWIEGEAGWPFWSIAMLVASCAVLALFAILEIPIFIALDHGMTAGAIPQAYTAAFAVVAAWPVVAMLVVLVLLKILQMLAANLS